MDRKLIKQFRRALLFESLLSGASSLSKVFNETEDEIEDVMRYIDKKVKLNKLFESKLFGGRKQ